MANEFKNAGGSVAATVTDVFTCATGKTSVLHSLFLTNKSNDAGTVKVEVYDNSATTSYLVNNELSIPSNVTYVFDKPINLESEDRLRLTADVANKIEFFASYLEA